MTAAVSQFVQWAELEVGTEKRVDDSFVVTDDPGRLQIDLGWTDAGGKTHIEQLRFYFLWTQGVNAVKDFPGAWLAAELGASYRIALNAQSQGCRDYAIDDLFAWGVGLFEGVMGELLSELAFDGGRPPDEVASDSEGDIESLNVLWLQRSTTAFAGPNPITWSMTLLVFNADEGGLQVEGVSDAFIGGAGAALSSTYGAAMVQALQDIAMKEVDVSINRGAAIFSVRAAVASH